VRGTSGLGVFGAYASVMFVNTDPALRRRGIGRGMTSAALHAARECGASQAGLDASDAGRRIYAQLGFESVAPVTRFHRAR
jgi:ribosomal protein S18 acetylase RimI-like enzyme